MEISLIDKRENPDEPGFDTPLGETGSMDLFRDRSSYVLGFKTDLAYYLSIKLTKVELDQLKSQFIEAAEKRKAKD